MVIVCWLFCGFNDFLGCHQRAACKIRLLHFISIKHNFLLPISLSFANCLAFLLFDQQCVCLRSLTLSVISVDFNYLLCITYIYSRTFNISFPQIFANYDFHSFYCVVCFFFAYCCGVFIVLLIMLLIISIIYYIWHYISHNYYLRQLMSLCVCSDIVCCCIMHIEINSVSLFRILIFIKFLLNCICIVFALHLYRFSLHKFILLYFCSTLMFSKSVTSTNSCRLITVAINFSVLGSVATNLHKFAAAPITFKIIFT